MNLMNDLANPPNPQHKKYSRNHPRISRKNFSYYILLDVQWSMCICKFCVQILIQIKFAKELECSWLKNNFLFFHSRKVIKSNFASFCVYFELKKCTTKKMIIIIIMTSINRNKIQLNIDKVYRIKLIN